jgi:uncharacterized protein (DUF1330 family)
MTKAYWIASYRSISDPEAVARYAQLAGPIIEAQGGRMLARGLPARAYEDGRLQRSVVIEFASVEAAVAAYESAAYQQVLAILQGAAERDIRILAGV